MVRAFCAIAFLAAMAYPAKAETDLQVAGKAALEIRESTRQLQCENEGMAAQNIMLMRQFGRSKVMIRDEAVPMEGFDIEPVIEDAFKQPRVKGQAKQVRASEKFKTKYKVACLRRTAP